MPLEYVFPLSQQIPPEFDCPLAQQRPVEQFPEEHALLFPQTVLESLGILPAQVVPLQY
jgi:hypothetical protein